MRAELFVSLALGIATTSWAAPDIQHWTTPQGTNVYLVQSAAQPMLDVKIDFDAGEDRATPQTAGVATLAAAELLDFEFELMGNEMRTPFEKLRATGARYYTDVSTDRASLYLRVLTSQKERALGVIGTQLSDAKFPNGSHAWRRKAWVTELESSFGDRNKGSDATMARLLYGTHPYANQDVIGADTVDDLSNRDVRRFHGRYFLAKGAVVSIVGDIDRNTAEGLVTRLMQHLPKEDPPADLPALPMPAAKPGSTITVPKVDAAQSTVRFGLLLPPRNHPDYPALAIGNYILGGGDLDSRLMREIRVNNGMAYSASSSLSPMRLGSEWQASVNTKRDQTDAVLALMKKTVADFVEQGPDASELETAKNYYRQRVPFWTESNAATLEWLSTMGYYQLPLTYLSDFPKAIEQLSAADVKAAWQRWVKPEKMAIVIVGGQPKAAPAAKADAAGSTETKPEGAKP
ncbi:putative zinc protease [Andreprevotia sp. IGB-42]|uniref:M16 family metallopeptidase n=1 Tax=Andreprevotia sp. IGB-42 TaxID=2497473 RepID=UPI0013573BB2|nr:pitrilysin family protein [Andreprevotia sp. IGB-42]KAF0812349.1 putative zinc protease [Andreprevotia sp. IGB-42]